MTTFTRTTAARTTDATRRDAETLLRDAAFVLAMTQRVKADLTSDRPTHGYVASSVRSSGLRLAVV